MKTNNKTVLLAILAVFAMIAAGAAVIAADESDAAATYLTEKSLNLDNYPLLPADAETIDKDCHITTSRELTCVKEGAATTFDVYVLNGKTVTITGTGANDQTVVFHVMERNASGGYKYLADQGETANDSTITVKLTSADDSVKITAVYGAPGTSASAGNQGTGSSFTILGEAGNTAAATITFAANGVGTAGTYSVTNSATECFTEVAAGAATVDNPAFGLTFADNSAGTVEYYCAGANVTLNDLENNDAVVVKNASATVAYDDDNGDFAVTCTNLVSEAGITFTAKNAANSSTIAGAVKSGSIKMTNGTLKASGAVTTPVSGFTGFTADAAGYAPATGIITIADTTVVSATYGATYDELVGTYNAANNDSIYAGAATTFNVSAGMVFNVPAGYTVKLGAEGDTAAKKTTIAVAAGGTIDIYGKIVGLSTGEYQSVITAAAGANAFVRPGATLTNLGDETEQYLVDYPGVAKPTKMEGTVNVSQTLENVVLSGDLTIAAGTTATVSGMLALNGYTLTVNGTLVVPKNTTIGASSFTGKGIIAIGSTGTLSMDGSLSANFPVRIQSGASFADAVAVSGLVAGYSLDGLTVSGDIKGVSGSATPAIWLSGAIINDDMTIPSTAALTVSGESVLADGILDVKGTYSGAAAIVMKNPDTCIVFTGKYLGGSVSAIVTEGSVSSIDKIDGSVTTTVSYVSSNAAKYAIGGFTLALDRESSTESGKTVYTQNLYITGSVKAIKLTETDAADEKLKVNGKLFVPDLIDDADLTVAAKASIVNANPAAGYLIAEGVVTFASEPAFEAAAAGTDAGKINAVGGAFSIEVSTVPVYYLTGVEYAISAAIGGIVDEDTVTLYGLANYEATLSESYEIGEDVIIALGNDKASVIVPADITLVVGSDANVAGGVLAKIAGKLVVYKDASCVVAEQLYDVTYSDEEKVTYCGLQTALTEAGPGDTITYSKNMAAKDALSSLSIPSGVKLLVSGTLYVKKTLSIPADASLVVTGTLVLNNAKDAGARMNVAGTADLTSGVTNVFGKNAESTAIVDVSGSIKYAVGCFVCDENTVVNGAAYDASGFKVISSLEAAFESGATVTLAGEITDIAEYTIAGPLVIDEGAKVTLGTINTIGQTITVDGALTAEIVGISGTDGEATLDVVGFTGTITNNAVAGKYTLAVAAMDAGSVYISEGTAALTANPVTIGEGKTFTVMPGAKLVCASEAAINVNAKGTFTVAGELEISEAITLNNAAEAILAGDVLIKSNGSLTVAEAIIIAGDVNVEGALVANDDVAVLGTLDIDASDASVAAVTVKAGKCLTVGAPTIGANGSITGKKLTLGADAYIVMYDGAEIDLRILEGLVATEIVVNEIDYATMIAASANGVPVIATMFPDAASVLVIPGYNMTGMNVATNWIGDNGKKLAADINIGADLFVCFDGVSVPAHIKVSWDTGMSVYIDNVKATADVDLAVGTHTVMVKVNPGYKFADGTTPSITFNGKAVTGLLAIEVTADMVGGTTVLSVTGDIVIDQPDYPEQEKEDNSMIMILLAVLVIMVVILAIVTVIRMMRS